MMLHLCNLNSYLWNEIPSFSTPEADVTGLLIGNRLSSARWAHYSVSLRESSSEAKWDTYDHTKRTGSILLLFVLLLYFSQLRIFRSEWF